MLRRLPLAALALAAVLPAACGGPGGPGPIPRVDPPAITCGSTIAVEDAVTASQPISYASPVVTGGAAPVTVACTPPSGSEFNLGETTVNCTAADAQGRQAACSFVVTLRHRRVALTRYLAFGDSQTAGENGRLVTLVPFIDIPNAYPTFLQKLFAERIPSQEITVTNAGLPGEKVVDNDGRLKDRIGARQAQVLLLLEGINDLNDRTLPQTVANALADNIRTARERGVQFVFISTLLPVAPENCIPSGPRCRGRDTPAGAITATNDRIRAMAAPAGARLVDPYELFNANRSTFIDLDGLHLRPEGNRALALVFWDAIIQTVPPAQLRGF